MTKEPEAPTSIYFVFLLYGIGTLLPWNSVLTSFDYFDDKMPAYSVIFVFPAAINCLTCVVMFFVVLFGRKIHLNIRIGVCFLVTAGITIFLPFAAIIGD